MERVKRGKEKVLGSGRYHSRHSRSWLGYGLVVLATCCLVSCTTLKKAGVTSLGAGGGAIVGSVLSSGAAAPILGATTGAFVTSAVTDLTITGKSKGKNMDSCAPDNFWTLLGDLASMGGWLLILVIIIPMVLGWFLPGPVKLKGRDKPQINPYLK